MARCDYDKAIEAYDAAIDISPLDAACWQNKASALFKLERYNEACNSYVKLIKISPRSSPAWEGVGNALIGLERPNGALKVFDRSIERNPFNATALYNKSLALRALSRTEEADDTIIESQRIESIIEYAGSPNIYIDLLDS